MDHITFAGISWETKSMFGLPLGVVAFGMWMLLMNDRSRNLSQTQKPNPPTQTQTQKPTTQTNSQAISTGSSSHIVAAKIKICASCGYYPIFRMNVPSVVLGIGFIGLGKRPKRRK